MAFQVAINPFKKCLVVETVQDSEKLGDILRRKQQIYDVLIIENMKEPE